MERVRLSPTAEELLTVLHERHGPLMFHQSGGCCDGSSPMCYPRGEFRVGGADLLLGVLALDTPFWISASSTSQLPRPIVPDLWLVLFVLDALPDPFHAVLPGGERLEIAAVAGVEGVIPEVPIAARTDQVEDVTLGAVPHALAVSGTRGRGIGELTRDGHVTDATDRRIHRQCRIHFIQG